MQYSPVTASGQWQPGPLPEQIRELILPHVQNHGYILEAADTYDRNLVVKAFMNDPLVKHKCRDEVR